MKIAALLTGKKNSSFKNKNLLLINKKPIFSYPAVMAKNSNLINNYYVSSDSKYILNYCSKLGYTKIKRPKKLSTKNSLHRDVIIHALNFMKKNNFFPDIIVVLLANAPIIKTKWINDCISILKKNKNITSVVPVVENNDNNPLRAKKIQKNYIKNFIKTKKKYSSNRQSLKKSYFLCHNFWAIKSSEVLKNSGDPPWNFMGKKVKPYIVKDTIDIHNELDYKIAKIIINDKKIKA